VGVWAGLLAVVTLLFHLFASNDRAWGSCKRKRGMGAGSQELSAWNV
jgi:hypothetical protein